MPSWSTPLMVAMAQLVPFVSVLVERNFREGCLQVQLALVVGHLVGVDTRMCQNQTAQSEVLHTVRSLDELLVDEVLRILLITAEDKVAHLLQVIGRCRTVVVVWTARPEGVLVQLDLINLRAAIDHSAQAPIADRQGFQPY